MGFSKVKKSNGSGKTPPRALVWEQNKGTHWVWPMSVSVQWGIVFPDSKPFSRYNRFDDFWFSNIRLSTLGGIENPRPLYYAKISQ